MNKKTLDKELLNKKLLDKKLEKNRDEKNFTQTEGKAEEKRLQNLTDHANDFMENLTIDRLERCGWKFDLERLTADYKAYCKAEAEDEGSCPLDDYIADLYLDDLDAYGTDNSLRDAVCEYASLTWEDNFDDAMEYANYDLKGFGTKAVHPPLLSYFEDCYSEAFGGYFVYSADKMEEILAETLQYLQMEHDKKEAEDELDLAEEEHTDAESEVEWREDELEKAEKEEFEVALRDKYAALVMLNGDMPEYVPSDAFQAAEDELTDAKEAEKMAYNKYLKADAKVNDLTELILYDGNTPSV